MKRATSSMKWRFPRTALSRKMGERMRLRLDKPWLPLCREALARLPGQLGVYQIADTEGDVVFIGFAGGRSRFGLRGELQAQLERRGEGRHRFRCEVNMQYTTRHRELLMLHRADHGRLPAENPEPPRLGRLRPA
jgi:hypothetical protein